jgi:AcrR family transcriptional regulator
MVTAGDTSKPKSKRDRKATEESIVEAFERVLLRDGVQGLGVNAIALEAGINKVLIYRYFQDLQGLARQWASRGSFWPTELELIGGDPDAFAQLEVRDRIRTVLCNYMDQIRARPRTVEMLAGELLSPSDTTRALADAMVAPGKGVADYIQLDSAETGLTDRVWRLIFVINGLTAFMAVRERNNPGYMGMDLREDEAWEFLRDTVWEIAGNYLKD